MNEKINWVEVAKGWAWARMNGFTINNDEADKNYWTESRFNSADMAIMECAEKDRKGLL